MILIDANVPIYAHGRDHPYRTPCQAIMNRIYAGNQGYSINTETLQEILHYYTRHGEVNRGIGLVEDLMPRFPEIIPITASEIRASMRLMSEIRDLTARDAIHAAVVFEQELEGIVSADTDFDRIPGLRRFDPIALAAE